MTGRSPDGSGSRPPDRAADGVSPVPASIPNAGFTPGPWEVCEDGPFLLSVRSALDGDVDGDTGQHIVVGGDLIAAIADIEDWEANARLIAAAPELYEIAARIAGIARNGTDTISLLLELNAIAKDAATALAKARGEA